MQPRVHKWKCPELRRDYHPCQCGCGVLGRGVYKLGHRPVSRYRWEGKQWQHRQIAELVLGKALPKGAQIHHVNGIKTDNRHCNLVICQDGAYHRLLHVRTKIIKCGGNPNTDSWCSRCRKPKLRSEFHVRKGQSGHKKAGSLTTACKACAKRYTRDWKRKHRATAKGTQMAM